jgi:trimeric autotransporter adhesin
MGKSGTNTVESTSAPPAQYLNAYSAATNQAQQVASTPYQAYQGQTVAQLSPDQTAAIGQVEGLTANGGVQAPYLAAAQGDITNATQPVLTPGLQSNIAASSGQALAAPTAQAVSGIQGATSAGTAGITGAAGSLTPSSVAQWESPYTSSVLNTTEASEANTDAQQQSQVTGNAISSGAFGGDRSAVASALTAGQQAIANNATNAGIEQAGYTTALGAAQQQAGLQTSAASSAGSLGLQGATAAGQAGMTGATTGSQLGLQGASTTLGANEAQGWLSSQAGAAEANLGSEAQSTGLQGASALGQEGGIEQQMAQENLNIPYEQFLGAQAYPFQTTGWEAGIDEGLGASAGGTSATTSPAASLGSQVAGLGIGGLGLANSGALNGVGAGIGNLFDSSLAGDSATATAAGASALGTEVGASSGALGSGLLSSGLGVGGKRGGSVPGGMQPVHRKFASGGMTPADGNTVPFPSNGSAPIGTPLTNVPDVSKQIVPAAPTSHGGMGIPHAPQAMQSQTLGQAMQQDVGLYNAAKKAGAFTPTSSNARGGMIPARALGGVIPTVSVSGNDVSVNPASIVKDDTKGTPTTTSQGPLQLSGDAQLINAGATGAASIFGGPIGGLAASAFSNAFPGLSPGGLSQETGGILKRGGGVPHRDAGGATDANPNVTVTVQPDPSQGAQSSGSGASPSWYAPLVQENLDNQMASLLTPTATATTAATDSAAMTDPSATAGMKSGGTVPPQHFDAGGFTSSDFPSWSRQEESESVNRHGLLASPIAGRTDKLAVSPATGSYVIPADVISGLGEGNTLAGANVMQKILETGPHGIRMPQERRGMGPPRPPPAYRESQGDDGMASGGGVPHLATGGTSSGGMSPAVSSYLAGNGSGGFGLPSGNGTYSPVPSTGINASTGQGTSVTGIPAVDAYLNQSEAGASFAPPSVGASPAPSTAAPVITDPGAGTWTNSDDFSSPGGKRGGDVDRISRQRHTTGNEGLPKRADGGPAPGYDDDMGLPDYSGHVVAPWSDDDDTPSHSAASPTPQPKPTSQPNALLKPHSDIKVSGGMQPASPTSISDGHVPPGWGAGHLNDTGHAPWPAAFMATPEGKAAFARAAESDRIATAEGHAMLAATPEGRAALAADAPASTASVQPAAPSAGMQPSLRPTGPKGGASTGMGPEGPGGMAPPSQQFNPSRSSIMPPPDHGSDIDAYMKRFQPAKADPWLALAQAGFAMAAGKSPHALENIGAGAEKGVASYIQQKQEASKEQQQAGETAARLADTSAYRQGVLGNRGDTNDIKRAQLDALGQYRQRAQQLQGQGLDLKTAHEQAWQEMQNQGLGIKQQQADTASTSATNRNTLGMATLAQKQEAQDALDKYRQQVQQRLSSGMDLKTAHEQTWQQMQNYLQQHHATMEDIQLARAFNPITGKAAFSDPHGTAQKLRDQNAPEPAPAAPPPAATTKPDVSSLWGN